MERFYCRSVAALEAQGEQVLDMFSSLAQRIRIYEIDAVVC